MDWEQFHRRSSLLNWHPLSEQQHLAEFDRPPYKCYQRFRHIELPSKIEPLAMSLEEILVRRTSEREFCQIENAQLLGRIVQLAASQHDRGRDPGFVRHPKRSYPSAGASYPLELYLLIQDPIQAFLPGVYHYCVLTDQLELIDEEQPRPVVRTAFNRARQLDNAVIAVVTAVLGRITPKYGDRGYRYALLEAGHLGQNLALACAEAMVACCPLGGFLDEHISDLLHLRSIEIPLYAFAIGGHPSNPDVP
jgi:SagB-type dehydrogenase family enzyme